MNEADSLEEHLINKRVEVLEERIQRRDAECQIWREAVALQRDVAVNLAPVVAHVGELEGVRTIMRDPIRLDEAVTARVKEDDAARGLGERRSSVALVTKLQRARVQRDRLHWESAKYVEATMRANARVSELEAEEAELEAEEAKGKAEEAK